jgi:hypothetical protein
VWRRQRKSLARSGLFICLYAPLNTAWWQQETKKCVHFYNGTTAPSGPGRPHYRGFTITLRHSTVGRTPLDEWSARCRDLYLTTHNTHKRHTSMSPVGFEPTIPISERPQTHALDRAATGIGTAYTTGQKIDIIGTIDRNAKGDRLYGICCESTPCVLETVLLWVWVWRHIK